MNKLVDFKAHLAKQLSFLQLSCQSYDAGHFNEGIRAAGGLITHCLCVFEYGLDRLGPSEGRRLLAEHDIKLHSLVTWDDVLSTGRDKSYFTDQVSRQIQDFLVEPEGWGRKMGFE